MTEEIVRNDENVQTAVGALFEGVVPEKNAELRELWQKYSPRFNILQDVTRDGRFILDAGAYTQVRVNPRALRAFWLASFIAWEGYRAVAEYLVRGMFDSGTLNAMVETLERILVDDDPGSVPLPNGVPEPGILPDVATDTPGRAAAELAIFAVGWAFLHEIGHLRHQQDGTAVPSDAEPAKRRAEETSCDEFATKFILSGVDSYAKSKGVASNLVRQKREIGIYFALFALTLIARGNWGESNSHPSVQERISAASEIMGQDNDISVAVAATSFAALRTIWPGAPVLKPLRVGARPS
jgi:hypothetical protein